MAEAANVEMESVHVGNYIDDRQPHETRTPPAAPGQRHVRKRSKRHEDKKKKKNGEGFDDDNELVEGKQLHSSLVKAALLRTRPTAKR